MASYTPLPEGSVRLLRLLPHPDENCHIECRLITLSQLDFGSSYPYEALSYVWGPEVNKKPIYMDGNVLRVTANLHTALSHLRYRTAERILWIDAICINQGDAEEKRLQVESMAKIYARASRVIVWLVDPPKGPPDKGGPAADEDQVGNRDHALEGIRAAAEEQRVDPKMDQSMVLALLGRKWFQRIWVLQEVAAARHILIKSGSTEIDGYAFCTGLNVLKPFDERRSDERRLDLRALILPMAYLIRGAVFRRRHERGDDTSQPARFSLNLRPLGELVDMYHTRKATISLDKVYALLGMSNDDPYAAGFEANYKFLWKDVFQKLVHFCLSDQASVSTWDDAEVAGIEARGCVLGEVFSAEEDVTPDNTQHVKIAWKTALSRSDAKWEQISRFALQASAKAIKKGDIICLLQGAVKPTIIRLCDGFSTIIRIAADCLPKRSDPIKTFSTDLLLMWYWDESQSKSQGGKGYERFLSSRGVPKCPRTECRCHDHLDKAARLWNFGILLNRTGRYKEAIQSLRKAVEVYGTGAALRSQDRPCPEHSPWREADKRVLGMIDDLRIDDKGAVEAKDKSDLAPLSRAAEKGHKDVVELVLAGRKADIDVKDDDSQTPLPWADWNGHEAAVQLLLATGKTDVDAKDENGWTPLLCAVKNGQEAIVELLLATGKADVNAKDENGQTSLSWAAEKGHGAIVKLLLATGKADVDVKDKWVEKTPLFLAAENGHEAVVELLLATGKADVNAKPRVDDQTPLSRAATNGHKAVVELLLATRKTAVDAIDKWTGQTPLLSAAENGHETVVKLLITTGRVNVNAKDNQRRTPLSCAAERGYKAVVELLVTTEEAVVDMKDDKGRTPLSWAAEKGHKAVVELLVTTGKANVDAKDGGGSTPLSWAAHAGHEAVVELLMTTGKADVDVKDDKGRTPLLCAVASGHETIVELLVTTGMANVNAKDNKGRTPLLCAVESGHETIVELLVTTGKAKVNVKDQRGQTPLVCATRNGHEAIVKLLMMTGKVNINKTGYNGWTPLSWAAIHGHKTVVELLLTTGGADVDTKDNKGRTSLWWAAREGHKAVVELLVTTGKADVDTRDDEGRTPLSWAAEKGHKAVVELLKSYSARS